MMCPQSWRGSPASLQLSQSPYSCPSFTISSRCLRDAFAMPLRCSPLETYCHWTFPDFCGASQSSPEFPSLLRSSPVFAGAPPCLLEFLLLPQSCQSHSTLRLPMCCERLPALSNPCWTLPVGCSLVHRGRVESTINLYPAKGKAMAMSAATTSLEWPD